MHVNFVLSVPRVQLLDELLLGSAGDMIQLPLLGQIRVYCANEKYASGLGMD